MNTRSLVSTSAMKLVMLAVLLAALLALMLPAGRVGAITTFSNPILMSAPDPYVMRHTDGFYYFMSTTQANLVLRKSATLTGIAAGTSKVIWTPPASGVNCCEIWAPEIHRLDNKWYVYFTASSGGGDASRRINVLENIAADPMTGSWVLKGQINTVVAGLDGTVWTHNGIRYFLYAGYGNWPNYGSAVYIARMSSPWTLTGSQVVLTQPSAAWENAGGLAVNEGPSFLEHGARMHMIFSAGACWSDDYSLGMLSANATSDPMVKASWTKAGGPVFAKGNGVYAVGHNSFVKSPNGAEDWLVYHGNSAAGQGCGSGRHTRAQKVSWNGDTPVFGAPLVNNITKPAGEPTADPGPVMRWESLNVVGSFIRHRDSRGRIDPNVSPLTDSQFYMVPGLANSGAVSFESVNFPGRFLRHRNGEIWLDPNDGSALFKADATFWRRAGLANSAHASFESYNFPGRYIRHRDWLLYSEAVSAGLGYSDATFIQR
jgi:GH43 family beta-xylosidase